MRRIVLALIALLALDLPASGSTVLRLDLPEVVNRAAIVCEARVLGTSTERLADGIIVTSVTLSVGRGLRGAASGTSLVVRLPGGEVGDEGLAIPGMPGFRAGEDVLVFLTAPTARGVRVPVGLGQGVLRRRPDPATGRARAVRDLGGLDLVDPSTGAPSAAVPLATDDWDGLLAHVTRLLAEDDARRAASPGDGTTDGDGGRR